MTTIDLATLKNEMTNPFNVPIGMSELSQWKEEIDYLLLNSTLHKELHAAKASRTAIKLKWYKVARDLIPNIDKASKKNYIRNYLEKKQAAYLENPAAFLSQYAIVNFDEYLQVIIKDLSTWLNNEDAELLSFKFLLSKQKAKIQEAMRFDFQVVYLSKLSSRPKNTILVDLEIAESISFESASPYLMFNPLISPASKQVKQKQSPTILDALMEEPLLLNLAHTKKVEPPKQANLLLSLTNERVAPAHVSKEAIYNEAMGIYTESNAVMPLNILNMPSESTKTEAPLFAQSRSVYKPTDEVIDSNGIQYHKLEPSSKMEISDIWIESSIMQKLADSSQKIRTLNSKHFKLITSLGNYLTTPENSKFFFNRRIRVYVSDLLNELGLTKSGKNNQLLREYIEDLYNFNFTDPTIVSSKSSGLRLITEYIEAENLETQKNYYDIYVGNELYEDFIRANVVRIFDKKIKHINGLALVLAFFLQSARLNYLVYTSHTTYKFSLNDFSQRFAMNNQKKTERIERIKEGLAELVANNLLILSYTHSVESINKRKENFFEVTFSPLTLVEIKELRLSQDFVNSKLPLLNLD